jgi:capsular exopolysaccharide synthesis family protein
MSHIFDALQRSEGEAPGTGTPVSSEATELLRRAERRAASRWETAALLEKEAPETAADQDLSAASVSAYVAPSRPEQSAVRELLPEKEVQEDSPTFETIPSQIAPQNRIVCFDDESLGAEAFRLLGVRLRHLRRDRVLKKVLITSTIPQEGKSMVAANLACTLALTTQQKVLLLEGDLRRPSLSKVFGVDSKPGLCECLQGQRDLARSVYHIERPGLWFVPAGRAQSNALELLQSGRLSSLLDQLAGWFDWIIIDSPPVLPLADTSVWARLADGILLVTREGISEKRYLQKGIAALEPKKLIGGLLNCSKSPGHNGYYYRSTNNDRKHPESD